MAFSILLLWACKEAVSQVTGTTSYGYRHFFVIQLSNVSLLPKYMTDDSIFDEKLGYTSIQNSTTISVFSNLFYIGATHLSNNIALTRYVNSTYSNWDNYNLDDNVISDTINNDGLESELEDLN